MATKLDTLNLVEKDPEFAYLWTHNLVKGVDGFKQVLKKKQRQMHDGYITMDGAQFGQINQEIVGGLQLKELARMKLKEKI